MKLPNKINSYKESVLYSFPIILKAIKGKNIKLLDLYGKFSKKMGYSDFVQALDCLYYLGQIEISGEGEINYVGHGSK